MIRFAKRSLLVALMALVGSVLVQAPAFAATLVVDDDGAGCDGNLDTHTDIASALAAASSDDTILVCPGTYEETTQLVIDKTITLTGSGTGTDDTTATIVRPNWTVPMDQGHSGGADVWLTTGASGTTIEDISFDFDGTAGTRESWGILIGEVDAPAVENVTIQNNEIDMGVGHGAAGAGAGVGITTGLRTDVDGLTISGNTFHGNATDGGGVAGAEGIYLNPSGGTGSIAVQDNTFDRDLFVGVSIEASNVTVARNIVEDTISTKESGTHGIRVNDFHDTAPDGIVIEDNVVRGFDNGFRFGSGTDGNSAAVVVTAEGNQMDANATGMLVQYDATVTAPRNDFAGNDIGADILDGSDGTLDATNSWWGAADGPSGAGGGSGVAAEATDPPTYDPWLQQVDVSASPTALQTGSTTTVTATLRNSDGADVGAAPVEARFTRTGANPLASPGNIDVFDPTASLAYAGSSAGTDTVTATTVFAGEDSTLAGTTTVTWSSPPGGGSTTPTGETVQATAEPGETVTTDGEGDGPTSTNPVEASVTLPDGGTGGVVRIVTELSTDQTASGFLFLGLAVDVTAPDQTPEAPLELTLLVDASLLPDGEDASTLAVFRDGELVRECTTTTTATPDPCVSGRETTAAGDAAITVLTSAASTWTLAEPVEACPPALVVEDGFSDVFDGNVHESAIDCIAWWGITRGQTENTYLPAGSVRRDAMAAFLARTLRQAGATLPAVPADAFGDDDLSPHELDINQLAEIGIVHGVSATRYEPAEYVTRAQTAALVVRTYEYLAGASLTGGGDHFADDDGGIFETAIDKAAEADFLSGTTDTTFEPALDVQRDQMASILSRMLNLAVTDDLASPPFA